MSNKWKQAKPFDRWKPYYEHSLPYRIFQKYNEELMGLVTSYESAKGYTYSHLKSDGALWESKAFDYGLLKNNRTRTVEEWSNNYSAFGNWVRLSLLMSLCSYFENFIASIIRESIESDPGILLNASHSIDGILLMKQDVSILDKIDIEVTNCTKGDWQSRIAHLEKIFTFVPDSLMNSVQKLERVRKLRNDYGHAFGRDIKKAQDYFQISKSEIGRLSVKSFQKYYALINRLTFDLDVQVMNNHICSFEPLLQYHLLYEEIKDKNKGEKLIVLKKKLQKSGFMYCNKNFCRSIIIYYENIL